MDFNKLPSPSTKRIALRISPPAERALRQGHPWVFDQSITAQSHEGAPGDLAVLRAGPDRVEQRRGQRRRARGLRHRRV